MSGIWDDWIGQAIDKAMREGKFENLSGQGKPFEWNELEEAFASKDDATINRVLANAGFAPEWIMERKEIEQQVEATEGALKRTWIWVRNNGGLATSMNQMEWERALDAFRRAVAAINTRIKDHNLRLNESSLALKVLDADKEIRRIKGVL
jgi:hypothetical protein